MKKILAMIAFATLVAACNNATEEAVVEEVVVDSTAIDTTVTEEVAAEGEEAAAE
jgi:hypothetical protein